MPYQPYAKLLIGLFSLFTLPAQATDYVWTIGGGPYLDNSQSQIELNVKWASDVITRQNPQAKGRIYYSDGDNPAPDIVNFTEERTRPIEVYDYVLGDAELNNKVYYNHTIANVISSTHADILKPKLEAEFKALQASDKGLILYNGHGGYNGSDLSRNHLRLWEETKLTVYDLEKLLSLAPAETPLRFIMTQCFSGAFGNAIHPEARQDTLALKGHRCGFMAESAKRESEGCSASIKTSDYRDYTTYFFAALDGKTRLGQPLLSNPDRDGDKRVTLHEAHLYTLENAYSTDLSQSTSEQYLEKWEPWYLRWLSKSGRSSRSVYNELAHSLAKSNKLPMGVADTTALRKERRTLQQAFATLKRQDEDLKNEISKRQKEILSQLTGPHPNIKKDYQAGLVGYKPDVIDAIKDTIRQHPAYEGLPELFKEREKITQPLLDAERRLTQVEKVMRMIRLAKLDGYFETFAGKAVKQDFSALLACEKTTL